MNAWLRRYARLVAASTLLLIYVGGLVTTTGSGLSVPDWPLSFGGLFPPMTGGVLYEHGHRLVAGVVALMTAALLAWIWRREPRRWVRRLAMATMGVVLLQSLLGGLTVLLHLPDAVSMSHGGLAQLFFGLTVTLAVVTGTGWLAAPPSAAPPPFATSPGVAARGRPSLPVASAITTGIIYVQVILGAWMRHLEAGLAIPDFPLSFGRLIPPLPDPETTAAFVHRAGALVVALAVLWVLAITLRRHRRDQWLVRPAVVTALLLVFQIVLGALTIWTGRAVIPTTLHVMVGAATLAGSLVTTLRAFRRFHRPARRAMPAPVREMAA